MTDSWVRRATDTANSIYEDFFQQVVAKHIIEKDRSRALSDKQQQQFDKGTHIDPRFVRLMTISGKGGYNLKQPELNEKYAHYKNCSLLDHLLSVTRGSLVFAAMDYLAKNPEMEENFLKRKLSAIAVIAFLHDIDKDLEIERNQKISIAQVEERCKRYGIDQYLVQANIQLDAEQLLYLIEKVEVTQANKNPPSIRLPREYNDIYNYPRLADKLDGIWASTKKEDTSGALGVINRLKNNNALRADNIELLTDISLSWKIVDIFDPHHPFLLDELQQQLSIVSDAEAEIYPLIEVHEDGRLLMLLPEAHYNKIIDKALEQLCQHSLPFSLEMMVSAKGFPSLSNGQPALKELYSFIKTPESPAPTPKALSDLFRLNLAVASAIKEPLIELLSPYQLAPTYPNASGATQYLYSTKDVANFTDTQRTLFSRLACAALLVNLLVNDKKVINFEQREQDLINLLGEPPAWIKDSEEARSRRIVLAMWAVIETKNNPELEKLLDELFTTWLEGTDNYSGLRYAIEGIGAEVSAAVHRHFKQLLTHQRMVTEDDTATGRCVFTDEPVPFKQTIDSKSGLYAVKVSAFSGRENRPEAFNSAKAHTNVGHVSIAEYRLRAEAHQQQGGKNDGIPNLISSPTTSGLFAGLQLKNEKQLREITSYSVFDLSRQEIKKGTVFEGEESYTKRCRIARFEVMPVKLADQVDRLRLLLTATLRFGRPVHVFRGLPTQRPEFFYYDALPSTLKQVLEGEGLRIEQIPDALKKLQFIQTLLAHHNLGHDSVQLYVNPHTRFKAICFAWCEFLTETSSSVHYINQVRTQLEQEFIEKRDQLLTPEGINTMDDKQDAILVTLGEKATRIQKYSRPSDSSSQQITVFNLCLETVSACYHVNQTDKQSLVHAIAGTLEENLTRRGLAAAKGQRDEHTLFNECFAFAEYFVERVWLEVLKENLPSQRRARILRSIYRMAFLRKHQENAIARREEKEQE